MELKKNIAQKFCTTSPMWLIFIEQEKIILIISINIRSIKDCTVGTTKACDINILHIYTFFNIFVCRFASH